MWLLWSVVAWQQVFAQVRLCACYAGSWSSIVPTLCCTDDLQDTRYFMELICSVPAKPFPMQILALANNAGKANQVSSLQTSVADTYGFQGSPPVMTHFYNAIVQTQDAQMTYAALANHRQPHLRLLGIPIAACAIPSQCQQDPAAGIDIPEQHELALLPDLFSGPLNGDKQTDLLRLVHYVVEGRSNHA